MKIVVKMKTNKTELKTEAMKKLLHMKASME